MRNHVDISFASTGIIHICQCLRCSTLTVRWSYCLHTLPGPQCFLSRASQRVTLLTWDSASAGPVKAFHCPHCPQPVPFLCILPRFLPCHSSSLSPLLSLLSTEKHAKRQFVYNSNEVSNSE